MRRRVLMLVAVLALVVPSAASADPQPRTDCTFVTGVTTCVETSETILALHEFICGPEVCVNATIQRTIRTTKRHGLRGRVFQDESTSSTFERFLGPIP